MDPVRVVLGLTLCVWLSAPALAATEWVPYTRIVEQTDRFIAIEIRFPSHAIRVTENDGRDSSVVIEGLSPALDAAPPGLPALVFSVGLPASADLDLTWSGTNANELRLSAPAIRDHRSRLTNEIVSMEEVQVRGLRVARFMIRPVRYDADRRTLQITRSLDIRIDFLPTTGPVTNHVIDPISLELARTTLLNGDRIAGMSEVMPDRPRKTIERLATATAGQVVGIHVDAEGLVRVSAAELLATGFDTTGLDPRKLQLSYRGSPIPCRITGEADGLFDSGDTVEFYGTPGTGRYSRENVYQLELLPGPGLRFATRDASLSAAPARSVFTDRVRFEEGNSVYTFGKPAQGGDPHFFWVWFEDNPNPPRVTSFTHAAVLPGVTSGSAATFHAFFAGRTDPTPDPDHRVEFQVNGNAIGETLWNGQSFHTASVSFDPALLGGGSNEFTLDFVNITTPDIYYLDWIEIDYPRTTDAVGDRLLIRGEGPGPARYDVANLLATADPLVLDVTDPLAPVELAGFSLTGSGPFTLSFEEASPAGRRFLVVGDGGRISSSALVVNVPPDLRNPANGADLIVVVPQGWESSLESLVLHRQAQGLRVVLASLTDVADEFAGGNVDDLAIRDFVGWAYANWQPPAVSHLLLVGEPNLDAMNNLGQSPHYHLMPTHFGVTEAQGETQSDNWFGAVVGADAVPDVAVGRFSVRSAGDAAAVAAKIIDYENLAAGGEAWKSNVMLVASAEQSFENVLDDAAAFLPAQFTVDRQYRRSGASGSTIRTAFGSGAVVSSFLGHGNVSFWADNPGGPFFDNGDASGLGNSGRLSFVTALNCLNGLIGHPFTLDSLSEEFQNLQTTGSLGFFSPSALGFLGQYEPLQSNLFETIFVDHQPRIGSAVLSSLVETYLTGPVGIDLVTKMILLGDPSGWLAIDVDGDGLLDQTELDANLEPGDRDSDDDGLLDGAEPMATADTDGDGAMNALDADADNDGLPDGLEGGVVLADPDTDLTRGRFRPDQNPATTTDPLARDSDGGGAPDGVEDANSDGAVGPSETDPNDPADDPVCGAGQPPEVAASFPESLVVERIGEDLRLSWGAASSGDPCTLYRLYVANDVDGGGDVTAFHLLGVTGVTSYTHVGAAVDGSAHRYLVAGETLVGGEGPWGHFGR